MFRHAFSLLLAILSVAPVSLAAPPVPWYERYHHPRVAVPQSYYEGLSLQRQTPLNVNAVRDVVCRDPNARVIEYDEHAAMLAICGGIAGSSVGRCGGSRRETEGRSGRAVFAARAVRDGATINVSKDRWVQCVGAARQACPTGSFQAVCVGGATRGDVEFTFTSE